MKKRTLPLVALATLASIIAGCGEKADYSSNGELEKSKAAPASTPTPPSGGGSVGGSPPVSVPTQERPSGN